MIILGAYKQVFSGHRFGLRELRTLQGESGRDVRVSAATRVPGTDCALSAGHDPSRAVHVPIAHMTSQDGHRTDGSTRQAPSAGQSRPTRNSLVAR